MRDDTTARGWTLTGISPPAGTTLYEFVQRQVADGVASADLAHAARPWDKQEGRIRFAPGLRDALFGGSEPNAGLAAGSAAIRVLCEPPTQDTIDALLDRLVETGAPQDIDRLMDAVHDACPRERVAELGRWLCANGTDPQVVKAGLSLLGISGERDDLLLISTLGRLDELTLYAAVAISNLLPEPDRALVALGETVDGWGRVHVVEKLAGSTNVDARRWLLRGGYRNSILFEYTAYIAATTGDLAGALQDREEPEEIVDFAGELLGALALGGPAQDMHDYADTGPALLAYFERMLTASPSLDRIGDLSYLVSYTHDDLAGNQHVDVPTADAIRRTADEALARPEWLELVTASLASTDRKTVERTIPQAIRLGQDVRPVVREWLLRCPTSPLWWSNFTALANAGTIGEIVETATELLPLETLGTGPEDELGLGHEYDPDNCLGQVLQTLAEFPGAGWDLIRTGLANRIVRVRNFALRALVAWPPDTWPPEAVAILQNAVWREPNKSTRRSMREALTSAQ